MSDPPAKKKSKSSDGGSCYFPEIATRVEYEGPSSSSSAKNPLSYRHYNPTEVVLGKPMKEWLKFSVCFWHTMRGTGTDPFGSSTLLRPWEDEDDDGSTDSPEIALAKRRIDVFFELLTKLQVEYYTFHDTDVAPEGRTLEETAANLNAVVEYLKKKQAETGVKLLWATQNLFSHRRYACGALSSPRVDVFCYAACQARLVADLVQKLDGKGHVFWGGREGYQSLLNTDLRQECDQMAAFYKMVVDYKKRNGLKAQLLIEPKPREPCKHQYDYDAQTALAFLHQYDLQDEFLLNLEPNHTTLAGHAAEHDVAIASAFGKLGSVDSNTGDPLVGWDTDQFPMELQQTASIMWYVVNQGGLPDCGGLNFDAKVRRESTDPIDIVIAHVGAMDCYALGLRKAVELLQDGTLKNMLQQRYSSWSGKKHKDDDDDDDVEEEECMGKKILNGTATLEDCVAYAHSLQKEPTAESGKQELYEMERNRILYK